jgi:hypothetical protein
MFAQRVQANDEQTALTYHRAAFTHYSMGFPLAAGVSLVWYYPGLALALTLVSNLVLLGILPRFRAFRRDVDACQDRRAASALRVAVLGQMSEVHCEELDELEGLAASVRRRCEGNRSRARRAPDSSVERWLGLQKLLALYAELAVTHHGNATSFCAHDRAALEREIDQVRSLSSGPWLERRRAILHRRQETWRRAAEERDDLIQGLATIGAAIRGMHELCALVTSDSVRAEVEDVLAAWESNGATLRELSCLRAQADVPAVDPRALALGREVMAQAAARARWRSNAQLTNANLEGSQ